MMNLRRLFFICIALLCQMPSHVALALRIDDEHFSIDLPDDYRFVDAAETTQIMTRIWGNPATHVNEQAPLGMIVAKNFSRSSVRWGIIITATHDGHVMDKDAARIDDGSLLQAIRREYFRLNKDRKAAGSAPVTSLDWAVEPHYDRSSNKVVFAKDIGFGKKGTRTLNYAVRVLGRENAIHFTAVGNMEDMPMIALALQAILVTSRFDSGFQYRDFNPRYHRVAEYGLLGLIAGQPKLRLGPMQGAIRAFSMSLLIVALGGLAIMLGRYVIRRRLPEF